MRENWRRSKGMTTLKFSSDAHAPTPVDIFVCEPFDFAKEYAAALMLEVCPDSPARVVSLDTLLKMRREAGRQQDLIDVEELQRTQ
jgi:hypothetical protein